MLIIISVDAQTLIKFSTLLWLKKLHTRNRMEFFKSKKGYQKPTATFILNATSLHA